MRWAGNGQPHYHLNPIQIVKYKKPLTRLSWSVFWRGSGFYRTRMDAFQCSTGDCVLVDDNAYNVESAKRFGMQGIRYTGIANLRTELMHLGVL